MRLLNLLGWAALALTVACGSGNSQNDGQGGSGANATGSNAGGSNSSATTTASGGSGAGSSASGGSSASSSTDLNLVINEIHYDPSVSQDENGEWIEVYNAGDKAAVLDGYVLRDNSGNKHTIGSLTINPGIYAVLARNGEMTSNGGVASDYVYGEDFFLANSADSVILESPGGDIVDEVNYSASAPWPEKIAGTSIELNEETLDNAVAANWQHAVLSFGDGDRGTPGKKNGGAVGTYEVDSSVVDWHQPNLKTSIYFAPHDDLQAIVLNALEEAQSQLRIAFFNVRLTQVRSLLEKKLKAGVDIHVILDKKQQDKSYNTMGEDLVKLGIKVTLVENTNATDATMHNKFTIIDGQKVLTGSANYSYTALNVSDEDLVVIDSKDLASRYLLEFDEIINAGDVKSVPYTNGEKVRAWMGPEDSLSYRLNGIIDNAQTSLAVGMFQLNTTSTVNALIAAKNRGVNTIVVLDKMQADDPKSTSDETLKAAGINVFVVENTNSNAAEMHSKFLVADHTIVLMGSYNFTALGSFHNDENILIIDDAHLAARVEGKFADLLSDYNAPAASTLGLTTGKQKVTFNVGNVTLENGLELRIKSSSGPFQTPAVLKNGSLSADVEAGTRIVYRYEIVDQGSQVVQEAGTRRFTVPYAPGPFNVTDAFVAP